MSTAIQRVNRYHHLQPADLVPPDWRNVFFDPIDTEVGIWATVDLLEPGATVLDLGSGSGAAAAAVARAGAGHVHGLDIADDSVRWASEHYAGTHGDRRISFGPADYSALTTAELLGHCPFGSVPALVTSNPPYVPVPPVAAGGRRVSIDGGPDGLGLVRHVVRHAAALNAHLALTIGSYTSPGIATRLLRDHGYRITSITLGALPLGEYTTRNPQRVMELAESGDGPLLDIDGVTHYLVIGVSCRRVVRTADSKPGPGDITALLQRACTSRTASLEALDGATAAVIPLRVLVLHDEFRRQHH